MDCKNIPGGCIDVDAYLLKAREKVIGVIPLIGSVIVVLLSDPSAVGRVYRLCCVLKAIIPVLPVTSSSSSSSSSSSLDSTAKGRGGGGQGKVMVRVFDGTQVSKL